jgi:O-antigen ligase
MSIEPKILILLIPIILIVLYFLLKYPEISFAFFISAYVLKGGINFRYFNLTAILLIITALGFILPLVIGKKISFTFQRADIWLLLFVIVLFTGCFISTNPQEGFIKAIRFTLIVFFSYILARVIFRTYKQIQLFIKTIFVIVLLVSILLIIISFFGEYSGSGRIEFLNVNQIPLGTLLAIGLVIAGIGVTGNINIFFNNRWSNLFCVVAIFPLLYSLFLTGCRGPLISAIIGLFCYYLLIFKKCLKITIAIGMILLFIMIIWISNSDIIYSILEHIPNISGYYLTQIKEGPSTGLRLELYSSAILLFLQKPLLGVGTGGFPGGYPHNIFLEIAAENGVFGLLLFICFLFSVIQKGFKYIILYLPKLNEYHKNIGLIVLTLSMTLFIEKQFSYGLDMHKDLFVFLGLMINLPLLSHSNKMGNISKGTENGRL